MKCTVFDCFPVYNPISDPHSMQHSRQRVAPHTAESLLYRLHKIQIIEFEVKRFLDLRVKMPAFDRPGQLSVPAREVQQLAFSSECQQLPPIWSTQNRPLRT